jgi:DNA repair exonuclease SbcCD ATPase subunit
MKKNKLRHLTVEGFAHSTDVSECEILEKELNEAEDRLKLIKKEVKVAKQKLNEALKKAIRKIESKKNGMKETQNNLDDSSESSSLFNMETIKSKYEETMAELELRKNKIKKKLEIYNIEGTENWDSFKHKLNHDLDELGKALKGFTTKP